MGVGSARRGGTSLRGTVLTWVATLLGVCLVGVGLLFAVVALANDATEPDVTAITLALAALLVSGGGLLIVLARRMSTLMRAHVDERHPTDMPTAELLVADTADDARGTTPVSRPNAVQPVSNARDEEAEAIAALVTRSDDVLATLKGLVRHEEGLARPSQRHLLASMLRASGLMEWEDAPRLEAGRLSRNHHYWMRLDTDDLDDEQYDRLLAVEAALGMNQDVPMAIRTTDIDDVATHAELKRLAGQAMREQTIAAPDVAEAMRCAYPATPASETPADWRTRVGVAHVIECLRTPFRVVCDFRLNTDTGVAALSLEIPRPRCLAIVGGNDDERTTVARDHARHLALTLARQVMHVAPALADVSVSCHERGGGDVLLAVRLTSGDRSGMNPSATQADGEDVRIREGADGWLEVVKPFMTLDDPRVAPAKRSAYPELADAASTLALAAATGANTIADLGINESAGRHSAWDTLAKASWKSTADAVADLVALRNATNDITVAEACARTTDALVTGTVDAGDTDGLKKLFVAGTALDRACQHTDTLLDDDDADPAGALSTLEQTLAPIDAIGAYLDDADTVYRYFGSIAERICFNRTVDDGQRAVRLVPDAYFDAKARLSIAYESLGRTDDALACADEMIRLAPTSAFAILRKARVLEMQSRTFEAADLVRRALVNAWTPRDAAICHYRLAYLQWKLGREDIAAACYQRALCWNTEIAPQAFEELNDLLAAHDDLGRLPPDQADALLAREGIPLGFTEDNQRNLLAAAVTCCDAGVFRVGRPLTGILVGVEGDDVLMDVYRSLAVGE